MRNKLKLLKDRYGKIDIPAKVFEEAVTAGKLNGYPDAEIFSKCIKSNVALAHPTAAELRGITIEIIFPKGQAVLSCQMC